MVCDNTNEVEATTRLTCDLGVNFAGMKDLVYKVIEE